LPREHTAELLPDRVRYRMVRATRATYMTGTERSFMVYGSRRRPMAMRCGRLRAGAPKFVRVARALGRRMFLMFHTHPTRKFPVPSAGDVVYVMKLRDMDVYGTFEGFTIGAPLERHRGYIVTWQVIDWKGFSELAGEVKEASRKYREYLEGRIAYIPHEIYEAQELVNERLGWYTDVLAWEYVGFELERVPVPYISPEELREMAERHVCSTF